VFRALAAIRTRAGRSDAMAAHRPVMLDEAIAGLQPRAGGIYIDATFGRGGHAAAILEKIGADGALHAIDQDPEAAAHAWKEFAGRANFRIHSTSFDRIGDIARAEGIDGRVAGILFDLGVSSPQFDDAARGFSFGNDGPLDMRMDPRSGDSAAQWLARAAEKEIADVLWQYGEERNSRRIARAIVERRKERAVETTAQLAQLILDAHRGSRQKIHPATRSFQAIRIFLNRELERLQSALPHAAQVLEPGGRLAVISFHSLEDRIVKRFIRESGVKPLEPAFSPPKLAPARDTRLPFTPLKAIARQFPSDEECAANPRARSAVLRIAEKVP
jgi:16S rRNA (cytosine1402-N4)-methyltransferase